MAFANIDRRFSGLVERPEDYQCSPKDYYKNAPFEVHHLSITAELSSFSVQFGKKSAREDI